MRERKIQADMFARPKRGIYSHQQAGLGPYLLGLLLSLPVCLIRALERPGFWARRRILQPLVHACMRALRKACEEWQPNKATDIYDQLSKLSLSTNHRRGHKSRTCLPGCSALHRHCSRTMKPAIMQVEGEVPSLQGEGGS